MEGKFEWFHTLLCAKFWQKSFLARTSSKNGEFSGFLAGAWALLIAKRIVGARRAGSPGPTGPGPTGGPSCRAPARPGALRGVVLALPPRRCRHNGGATPAEVRGGAFGLEIPVTSHTFMCQIFAKTILSWDFEQNGQNFGDFIRLGGITASCRTALWGVDFHRRTCGPGLRIPAGNAGAPAGCGPGGARWAP